MVQGMPSRVNLDLGKSRKARIWRSHSGAVMVVGLRRLSALVRRREKVAFSG